MPLPQENNFIYGLILGLLIRKIRWLLDLLCISYSVPFLPFGSSSYVITASVQVIHYYYHRARSHGRQVITYKFFSLNGLQLAIRPVIAVLRQKPLEGIAIILLLINHNNSK